jgi:hypothetical protein
VRLALDPSRPSVLPPGAGNELKEPIKAEQRAKKREQRYIGKAIVLERDLHAATIRRDHDGDSAAILSIELAQSGLQDAAAAR